MPQTIQLKRTTSITPPPMTLAPGELSVEVGPGPTRVWLGDGTTNRLLISSASEDSPVAGGDFVHLTGDTMTGFLTLVADPRIDQPLDAATKQYVDQAAGLTGTYRGLYDPTTNTPDISAGDTVNQANYIVSVTGNMSTTVAGIPAGTPMTQGDRVIWSQDLAMWTHLSGGGGGAGLDKPTADTFYVNVVGDIMTGGLIMQAPNTVVLGKAPTASMEAVPLSFLQSQLSGFLPLAGGVLSGPVSFSGTATLTLAQDPVSPLEAVTKQYVDLKGFPEAPDAVGPYGRLGAPSRSWVRAVAVGGDTITGTLHVATGANVDYQGNGNGQTAAPPVTLTNGPWTVAPIAFAWDGTGKLRWKVGGTDGGTIPGGDLSGAVGFPEAPTDGKVYGRQGSTASWQPVSSTVVTDPVAPASPVDGQLWWDSDSGQLFIRYDDGNSQQWVQANSSAQGGGSVAFPIPIVQGGTGQTTAPLALDALNGLSRNGGTMNGQLILSGPPLSSLAAVNRDFVTLGYLPLTGGVSFPMTGPLFLINGGPPSVALSFSTAANVGLYGTTTTVGISVAGQPKLVTDSAGVTINGIITGSGTLQLGVSAADAIVDLRRASASFSNIIYGRTGNSLRWEMRLGTNTPESGGNAGGNFVINRFGDNGVQIDTPLVINRANGDFIVTTLLKVIPPSGYAGLFLNKSGSGQGNVIQGNTGAIARWIILPGDASAETGSNAGSDFQIQRFTDAGAFIDTPLSINRATGTTAINSPASPFIVNAYYMNLNAAAGMDPLFQLNKPASGRTNYIVGQTNGLTRWSIALGNSSAESGGNVGSDFELVRWADNGTPLGPTILQIPRNSGIPRFNIPVEFYSGLNSQAYTCRNGASAPMGSNSVFNIGWPTGGATLWIDNTNLGTIAFSCDYRIKENIVELPSVWDKLKALRPISYTRAENAELLSTADPAERWGFLAHELQETLLPTAASAEKDAPNVIQSPDMMALFAVLTRALQEAMGRIEALEGAP